MRVMAAGMHPARVLGLPRHLRLFLNREGVNIRTEHDGLARPSALQEARDTGLANPGAHCVAKVFQPVRYNARGPFLLEPEFRVTMEIASELNQMWHQPLHFGRDIGHGFSFPRALWEAACRPPIL